ncbi:MAG: biopolymer transporter ExbD [Gammaproteobacteria bacterium]|nr:biopolymer transporter ExbD [Gammaproteobacteria bacterium]MDE2345674.1 biopolymer transporter ExbD [Gammaproteobacteria bacterium]
MHLRYFEVRKGRIEIIPMIDVMFFMLVFFIVITVQMLPDQGLNLQLPLSNQTKPLPRPQVLINIAENGLVTVKGQALSMDELAQLLQSMGAAQTQVTIAASRAVPFQQFVTVMDAVRHAGVVDIGIAARPSP